MIEVVAKYSIAGGERKIYKGELCYCGRQAVFKMPMIARGEKGHIPLDSGTFICKNAREHSEQSPWSRCWIAKT